MKAGVLRSRVSESLIRRITLACETAGAVNLAQAYPDYDTEQRIKNAAISAIAAGHNQYSHTWGCPELRKAISEKYYSDYGLEIDPDQNILVTCGCMEALRVIIGSIVRSTDEPAEIVLLEPFYESFLPQILLEGGVPRFVPLRESDYSIDIRSLETSIGRNTRAVIINSPNNPCGKVLSQSELLQISSLCSERGLLLICDETYEHILYDSYEHHCLLSFDNSRGNLVVVTGTGKTYATTGWRIGYLVASREVVECVRASHDYNTVCAPTPLQYAIAELMNLPDVYYDDLRASYAERKASLFETLCEAGFECFDPQGAYYVWADYSPLPSRRSSLGCEEFVLDFLVPVIGVGAVPGTAFYGSPARAGKKIRFTFSKSLQTLAKARERLLRIKEDL